MSRDEQTLEDQLHVLGADRAPRITPDHIDSLIVGEFYKRGSAFYDTLPGTPLGEYVNESMSCLTICVLVLRNGFTVIGTSACASPENYNEYIGRKLARKKARDQIWPLEGYRLRTDLSHPLTRMLRAKGDEEKQPSPKA